MTTNTTQFDICFAGHVQGVGFRYTVCQLAERFAVAGTVKNLADGCVRLLVEGTHAEVFALVKAIEDHFTQNIRDVETHMHPATGKFGEPRRGGVSIAD